MLTVFQPSDGASTSHAPHPVASAYSHTPPRALTHQAAHVSSTDAIDVNPHPQHSIRRVNVAVMQSDPPLDPDAEASSCVYDVALSPFVSSDLGAHSVAVSAVNSVPLSLFSNIQLTISTTD
ncbi:hypothetical protein LINGRAHAP2_LOCUS1846 [Linum grandiflorum]